jgi:hypothetical protein
VIQSAYVSVPTIKRVNGNFVTIAVTGNGTVAGNFTVTGAGTFGSLTTGGDLTVGGSTVDLGTAAVGGSGDFSWSTGEFVVSCPIVTLDSPVGQLGGTWSALTSSTVNLLGAVRLGNTIASPVDLRGTLTTANGGRIIEKSIYGSNTDATLSDNTVRRIIYTPTTLSADHTLMIDFASFVEFQALDVINNGLFNLTVSVAGYGVVTAIGPGSGKRKIEFVRITSAWTWVIL